MKNKRIKKFFGGHSDFCAVGQWGKTEKVKSKSEHGKCVENAPKEYFEKTYLRKKREFYEANFSFPFRIHPCCCHLLPENPPKNKLGLAVPSSGLDQA